MKKIYMSPEMDVVEIKHQQTLLAGSVPALATEEFEIEDPILAPSLDVSPNIPDFPGIEY